MSAGPTLLAQLEALTSQAESTVAGTDLGGAVRDVRDRLRRPLRVALAGRSKAGKSTLLNALVGERLAATDATECTRIVTWYQHDLGYSVRATLQSGERRPLPFERAEGSVAIQMGGLSVAEVRRLEVGWPSSRLEAVTLIDTPGLDSSSSGSSQRTIDELIGDEPDAGEADAVVYLMRHLHRRDADFLEAFSAGALGTASPVNALAVLSRSDEIGGGRLDALESAASIAGRYAADPRVRERAINVLPIAGLLAETGATLVEAEVSWLRGLAAAPAADTYAALLSVDRFRTSPSNPTPEDAREVLLARFGLFGLRHVTARLRERPGMTAQELARLLIDDSGVGAVDVMIRRHFAGRADVLKARSALARLRSIAAAASLAGLPAAAPLASEVERVAAGSHELAELRLLHGLHAGWYALRDDELPELERLLALGSVETRLGQPDDAPAASLRPVVIAAIDRWRTRAANPLLDRATADAAATVARTYEGLYQVVATER